MKISNLLFQIVSTTAASSEISVSPFDSNHLRLLTFKQQSLNSLKPRTTLTSHLSDFFTNDDFDDEERMEIIETFCDLFKNIRDDLTVGSKFSSLFNHLLNKSKFIKYENVKASLSLMSKISSSVKKEMLLPLDYASILLLKIQEENSDCYPTHLINDFTKLINYQLNSKYKKDIKKDDSWVYCIDFRKLAMKVDQLRILCTDYSGPGFILCSTLEMFTAYFNIIDILMQYKTLSVEEQKMLGKKQRRSLLTEKDVSYRISNLIDTVTQNFIGIIACRRNPNFVKGKYNIFSKANREMFVQLGFDDYFPVTELVHLTRDNMCSRLSDIIRNTLNEDKRCDLPVVNLKDMQDLLNHILKYYDYAERKIVPHSRIMSMFYYFVNSLSLGERYEPPETYDIDLQVHGIDRLDQNESKELHSLKDQVDSRIEDSILSSNSQSFNEY